MTNNVVSIKGRAPRRANAAPKNSSTDWQNVEDAIANVDRYIKRANAECRFALREVIGRCPGIEKALTPEELVRKAEVRKTVRKDALVTETMQIASAATLQADIILGHRQDVPAARKLVTKLFKELELQTDGIELLQELGELMYAPNESGQDKLNELYRKVISLPSRSSTAKSLVDSMKGLIALEREAFGLDDDGQKDGAQTAVARMTDAERAVRLMDMLQLHGNGRWPPVADTGKPKKTLSSEP